MVQVSSAKYLQILIATLQFDFNMMKQIKRVFHLRLACWACSAALTAASTF